MHVKRSAVDHALLRSLLPLLPAALGLFAAAGCDDAPGRPPSEGEPRPFLMGMTPFPAEPTPESLVASMNYVAGHADVVLHHHDGGIPWSELMNDRPLPADLLGEIEYRAAASRLAGLEVFVAATPLNRGRNGLAPEWRTELPPPGFEGPVFGEPSIQEAYEEWCLFLAESYLPDYFAVVIEANMYEDYLESNGLESDWPHLLDLYQRIYTRIKQRIGDIPVFLTFQLEFLRGDLTWDFQPQWDLLGAFRAGLETDFLALSTYPSVAGTSASSYGPAYLIDGANRAREFIDSPVLVSETGFPSRTVEAGGMIYVASEDDQRSYLASLLAAAEDVPLALVTWFFPFDFPEILRAAEEYLPPEDVEALRLFVPMGFHDESGFPKLASDLWDATLIRPAGAAAAPAGAQR
jgi:hypothetical protein